jgi:hypothetical protein
VLTNQSINALSGIEFYFKCENFQKIGAFKIRGGMNASLKLSSSSLNLKFSVGTKPAKNILIPSRTEKGIVGDIDFDAVQNIAGAVTPMPGGTGPMTIACLLENTLTAAALQGVKIS